MKSETDEEVLLGIVLENCRRMVGLDPVREPGWADRKLRHLGVDSVGLYELLSAVEARAGIAVPDTLQLDDPTPRQLVRILKRGELDGTEAEVSSDGVGN